MPPLTDMTDTAASCLDDAVPDDPFTSLRFHFGMLLGVDDFETEQAYHRGQTRLHQSWLHGAGVVWGLGVSLDEAHSEVRVERGLAYDGAGRPLHLDGPACLDPGAWLDRHDAEVERSEPPPQGADTAFDAHVEARWASCLTRPVPALAEPCDNAGIETAYSRVWETIELRLVPGLAGEPPVRSRRVRILLGLLAPGDAAGDADAARARAAVLATAEADRTAAALAAFRAQANADALTLAPPESAEGDGEAVLTAEAPPAPVVLANLRGVALRRTADGDGWTLVGGTVELLPRRSHVAGETVQELVVAAFAAGPDPDPHFRDVALDGATLRLEASAPLDARTVQPAAFAVSVLGDAGWSDVAIAAAALDGDTVVLTLDDKPAPPWQVIALGWGPAPLLGADLSPLSGGRDFVHLERS